MNRLISILDGNTFLVCDENGDVLPAGDFPTGLFSFDTRFLSTWRLTINGQSLHSISLDETEYYESRFFLAPGRPTHYLDAKLSVIRDRTIGHSFTEGIVVFNHERTPAEVAVRVDAASDFADIFEIKDSRQKKGAISSNVDHNKLKLTYCRESFQRETIISSTAAAMVDCLGMTFQITIPPHGEWTTRLHVETVVRGAYGLDFRESLKLGHVRSRQELASDLLEWREAAPKLICDCPKLSMAYRRSIADIAALRYRSVTLASNVVAAGLPWFMTIFGRDSLITCLQSLPFIPELSPATLGVLAYNQGSRVDNFRDEEPGKILHELRYGESAGFEEQPHSPYFGSADATPLFIILLDEYERWTGDATLVQTFELEARRALDWIDRYADHNSTGYIWYETRNHTNGLVNQCWKDSPEAVSYRDGRLPGFPRATCELQGYAYDAKVRGARMALTFWNDAPYAKRLLKEAAELKKRFNRDYWVEEGEYYAMALGPDGEQVDAMSSNMGHLLWSGIVEEPRAKKVAEHLLGPKLFSGWGVRTLATDSGRFNPLGYHVGTVWPFDNSLIAWGLWRYGLRDEANVICQAMTDASEYFQGRLPEAFAGYDRARTSYPVEYPTACSPQAWSAGTPLLLIRTMLGLEPSGEHLIISPAVPPAIGRLELLDIPGRWGRLDALGRSRDGL